MVIALYFIDRSGGLRPVVRGWTKYENETLDVQVSYPGTGEVFDGTGEFVLPEAPGGKERRLGIENFTQSDEHFGVGGCLKGGDNTQVEIGGKMYCLTTIDEAALGSTYRTYAYALPVKDEFLVLSFVIRFPTTVETYEGCQSVSQQQTTACQELAFDELRDTRLFKEILETVRVRK